MFGPVVRPSDSGREATTDRGFLPRLQVVGDGDDLQSLLTDFPEEFEPRVGEVGDYDRRHATIAAGLTDRQVQAIEIAVGLGYYAVPWEASFEAVADELRCAESTASNHLRKAEERVMRRLVRQVAPSTGPAADQGGTRRRGSP